jgi:hypothetical protein
MRRMLVFAVSVLGSVAVWAQAPPPQVFPVPIPGGDVVPPPINAFAPGDALLGFDGLNAEPYVITNIEGVTAMGYTMGQATDSAGTAYQVMTDIRVFQGDYIGRVSTSGVSASTRAHGTFVLI